MADLKYFISEHQRFRTAADCESGAMISPRGSLHPAVALVFTTENNDTMVSEGGGRRTKSKIWPCIKTFWQWSSLGNKHEPQCEKRRTVSCEFILRGQTSSCYASANTHLAKDVQHIFASPPAAEVSACLSVSSQSPDAATRSRHNQPGCFLTGENAKLRLVADSLCWGYHVVWTGRVEPSWMGGWINGRKDGPQPVELLSAVPLAVSSGFRVSD